MASLQTDVVVIGGGLAGIVTALEALRDGQRVALVDRDTPERFGGLALWAFGGMALVDTPLQRRRGIADSPERALADWLRFGELDPSDTHAVAWARHYVERSRTDVHDWLQEHGIRFMPAVNWVERGRNGDGNTVPRYHIVWGTSRELTRRMIAALRGAGAGGKLTLLHRHRVTALETTGGRMTGVLAVEDGTGKEVHIDAPVVVLATGGLNGSHAALRRHWPPERPRDALWHC